MKEIPEYSDYVKDMENFIEAYYIAVNDFQVRAVNWQDLRYEYKRLISIKKLIKRG